MNSNAKTCITSGQIILRGGIYGPTFEQHPPNIRDEIASGPSPNGILNEIIPGVMDRAKSIL